MAGAGAGADQAPPAAGEAGVLAPGDPDWRDWAGGVPVDVLAKVAETLVAQTEAGWAAWLKEDKPYWWTQGRIQQQMESRQRRGPSRGLFVFARVCKEWRKAQLKVGGPLRTRMESDVILPGRVALAKWALAEGCPREWAWQNSESMALAAAQQGHRELVQWLIQEQGFAMDRYVAGKAAWGGNLELVKWLRGEGCPWNEMTTGSAVAKGHVEVLRWARENGCPWKAWDPDRAAEKLGYTDNFGNVEW